MNLYTYDLDTKEYTGTMPAQKRPNGDYITEMIGGTTVAPPEMQEGYAAVWNGTAWSLTEDHRQKYDATGVKTGGTPYWLDGDTYETAARYMTELGPLPDGALLVQPVEPEPTLEEAQQSQIETINTSFTDAVALTKYNVPEDEVLTWDIQKLEAQAWELNNETATPFIDGIAEARGIDRVELIEKVLLKVAAYKAHVSTQVGKRQRYEGAIYAAATLEDVYAVVWENSDTEPTI